MRKSQKYHQKLSSTLTAPNQNHKITSPDRRKFSCPPQITGDTPKTQHKISRKCSCPPQIAEDTPKKKIGTELANSHQ
jgi:hypothetical protein